MRLSHHDEARSFAPLRGEFVDHRQKLIQIERLGQVIARAGREETLNLARRGVGTQNYHWDLRGPWSLLQAAQNFRAMHVRQIKIEQHQFRLIRLRELHAKFAADRMHHTQGRAQFQNALDQGEIHDVVFHVKNVAAALHSGDGTGWESGTITSFQVRASAVKRILFLRMT